MSEFNRPPLPELPQDDSLDEDARSRIDPHASPLSRVSSVWLHGAGLSGDTWHHITAGYPLSAMPDIPGHGTAPLVQPPRVETYADIMQAAVPRGAILIGHSLGGMVALELAARLGHHVAALILIEAVPTVRDRLSGRIAASLAKNIYRVISPRCLASLSGIGQPERTRAELRRQLTATDRTRIVAALDAAGRYDGRPHLPTIRVPTLIIIGTDNKATHRSANLMAREIPSAQLLELPGGHMLHTDNPDALLEAIDGFVHSVSDIGSARSTT